MLKDIVLHSSQLIVCVCLLTTSESEHRARVPVDMKEVATPSERGGKYGSAFDEGTSKQQTSKKQNGWIFLSASLFEQR